jgi:hypothetical protein
MLKVEGLEAQLKLEEEKCKAYEEELGLLHKKAMDTHKKILSKDKEVSMVLRNKKPNTWI